MTDETYILCRAKVVLCFTSMQPDSVALQGYLKKQSRNAVWKTRFFQQESSKLLYFEKDVVRGVIDLVKIVSVAKKDAVTFCIATSERQYVLAPVNSDAETVDYWVDGLNRWLKVSKSRTIQLGVRNRDSRSVSVGVFGDRPPVPGERSVSSMPNAPSGRSVSPSKPLPSAPIASGSPLPMRSSSAGAVSATNSPKVKDRQKSLLRLPTRLRNSGVSSPEKEEPVKVGSAPSGSHSARAPEQSRDSGGTLSAMSLRKANRAKSMEDVHASGDGVLFGALARLAPASRENVVQLQRGFLDFRRLALKTQLVEVHVRAHDEDQKLLPEIRKLEIERDLLQAKLLEAEKKMQAVEAEYYRCGAELATSFVGMLEHIKKLNSPLSEVVKRLQDLYKQLSDPDVVMDSNKVAEVSVLVAKFRSFLPLLEDALTLDKPLTVRKNAIKDKLELLQEQNRQAREALAETEESVAMTQLDCITIRDFAQKADMIGETLSDVLEKSSSLLPWMTVPNSQIHSSLSRCAELLQEETQSLKAFRDQNFLDILEKDMAEDRSGEGEFELGDDGGLAYVSAEKLVELVVTGKGAAYALDVPKIFVTTFHLLMSPVELLERLILIYCTVPSDSGTGDKTSEERKLAPCRLRILNLLKKWIQMHRYDFEDPAVSSLISDFLHNTIKLTGYERVAENLQSLLQSTVFPTPSSHPEPIVPRKHGDSLQLCDIEPLELARQMTLDDMIYYHSLECRDFFNCAWSKKNDPRAAPTIKAMIAQFNCTAEWVAGLVLKASDDASRAKTIRHFVLTANELLKMNNFNSCLKIVGSLSGQAIHRLHCWERVPKEDMKTFQELKALIGDRWAGLRELIATCGPPSIPVISPYLGDLTYIDEMKSKSGKNLHNFRKLTLISQAIEKVLNHVDMRYSFAEVGEIRRWIQNQEKMNRLSADEAHAISLQIQPRQS